MKIKNEKIKNNSGVTLIALVVTIVVLLIISAIVVNNGTKTVKNAKLESLKTNMLLIQAKTTEYCEEASFKLGTEENPDETKIAKAKESLKGSEITDLSTLNFSIPVDNSKKEYIYSFNSADLEQIGMGNIESDEDKGIYYVKYNVTDVTVEVYNSKGFEKDGTEYYSLTELQNL